MFNHETLTPSDWSPLIKQGSHEQSGWGRFRGKLMKIHRGDYEGASRFAYFDKPVQEMNVEECRSLLMAILHRAMPGEGNSEIVYKELAIAEQCWKEQEGRMKTEQPERRKGETGVWTFVLKTAEGKILATSAWGTNYEFDERYWKLLPVYPKPFEPEAA